MSSKELKSKKSTVLKTRSRRIFSYEFKRQKVKEIVDYQCTIDSVLYTWNTFFFLVFLFLETWALFFIIEHNC